MATEYQGYDAWEIKFKPRPNHFKTDELMFETYGEEVDYVRAIDPKYVWTYVDGDMSSLLVAGYHYVNRIGYYVCEVPWEDDMDSCLLSVEVECECYDEETDANPECTECDGYGLITRYVEAG